MFCKPISILVGEVVERGGFIFADVCEHTRLARECAKLDVNIEQEMAGMGLDEDLESWPNY